MTERDTEMEGIMRLGRSIEGERDFKSIGAFLSACEMISIMDSI